MEITELFGLEGILKIFFPLGRSTFTVCDHLNSWGLEIFFLQMFREDNSTFTGCKFRAHINMAKMSGFVIVLFYFTFQSLASYWFLSKLLSRQWANLILEERQKRGNPFSSLMLGQREYFLSPRGAHNNCKAL